MMNFFKRQIPVIGKVCQEKLRNSRVLIAGVGGLGTNVSEILTRNGVGEIYLVDDDTVDDTNLHRQISYRLKDVGKKKVGVAKTHLKMIGLKNIIHIIDQKIDEEFQISKVDIVVDCLDDPSSKIILSEIAAEHNIFFVHAGVDGCFGQILSLKGKSLADVLSFPRKSKEIPALLQTVSLTASIQSMEVLKLLCNKSGNLIEKILFLDLLNYDFEVVDVKNV